MKSHRHIVIIAALVLTGCASSGGTSRSSETQYIRDTNGQTQARIQNGNVYAPNGVRTHRIDSSGNIYSTTSSNGGFAGQRVGRIK